MNLDEKLEIVKKIETKLGFKDFELTNYRDDEISADFIFIPNMRGPGGYIVGDDGSILFCQSAHGYTYWKEEYKKGKRTDKKFL